MSYQKKNNDIFDFTTQTKKDKEYRDFLQKQKSKENFLKFGALILSSSIAFGAIGVGVYKYDQHVDNSVSQASSNIKNNYQKVMDQINKESLATKKKFTENQINIAAFAKYKDVIEVLGLQSQIGALDTQNTQAFTTSLQGLGGDKESINQMNQIFNGQNKSQKYDAIDSDAFKNLQQWKDFTDKGIFKYYGSLTAAANNINAQMTDLEMMKKVIVQSVQQTLRDPNFNLEATLAQSKSLHTQSLLADITAQTSELSSARSEIAGTEFDNVFPEEKYKEALTAFNEVSVAGVDQIQTDLAVVRQLALSQQAKDKSGISEKQEESTAQPTNQVVHVHSGPSFADYYLMHTWMSSSPSYQSSTTSAISNLAGKDQARAPSLNKNLGQINNMSKASYHISNDSSILSKSISGTNTSGSVQAAKAAISSKPNMATIRASINNAKASIRAASVAKSSVRVSKGFSGGGRVGGGFGG